MTENNAKEITQVGVRMTVELKEWAQAQADADNRPLSNWIMDRLQAMKEQDGKEQS